MSIQAKLIRKEVKILKDEFKLARKYDARPIQYY